MKFNIRNSNFWISKFELQIYGFQYPNFGLTPWNSVFQLKNQPSTKNAQLPLDFVMSFTWKNTYSIFKIRFQSKNPDLGTLENPDFSHH